MQRELPITDSYQQSKRQKYSTDFTDSTPRSTPHSTPQIIVFLSRINPDKSGNISIFSYNSIDDFYNEFKSAAEEQNHNFISFNDFKQMTHSLPANLVVHTELTITIHCIHEFHDVPNGRHVTEIVSAIYYSCAMNGLIGSDNTDIKCGVHVMNVLMNPNEILNPLTFNWDIPKLIDMFKNTLSFSAWLDRLVEY
jgi:hypothetical protein